MTQEIKFDGNLLRVWEVAERLSISTAAVWYKTNPNNRRYDPDFPKPIKVSSNVTGWIEQELNNYIEMLADKRNEPPTHEEAIHEIEEHSFDLEVTEKDGLFGVNVYGQLCSLTISPSFKTSNKAISNGLKLMAKLI
ncbi:helix-turn-helix transcriptional regulator [Neisseria animalis]|uniref:helix-turn-helix transcriptional regulator n=1 Tax=Neisseria animalis TaxID=492 RepID=UPI000F6F7415|nr:AlpA family phage regulatory protein [Neisseria animalis]VEE09169.1 putative prophage regulator protein [Neisseria animalis]